MSEQDQGSQLCLYRGRERHRAPDIYCLRTLVFGARSSPCSAIYVLNRNADEFEGCMPQAVRAIRRNFCMDDYPNCVGSEVEALDRIKQIIEINESGGFKMHKWTSNSESIMRAIPASSRQKGSVDFSSRVPLKTYTKTLGLIWNPSSDTFSFNVNFDRIPHEVLAGRTAPSKRQMLGFIMSIFDPLGFLCPLTVRSRNILQAV